MYQNLHKKKKNSIYVLGANEGTDYEIRDDKASEMVVYDHGS